MAPHHRSRSVEEGAANRSQLRRSSPVSSLEDDASIPSRRLTNCDSSGATTLGLWSRSSGGGAGRPNDSWLPPARQRPKPHSLPLRGGRSLRDHGDRPWSLMACGQSAGGAPSRDTIALSIIRRCLPDPLFVRHACDLPRDRTSGGEGQPVLLATRTPSAKHESRTCAPISRKTLL